ncbi:MAG: endonuclease/exonuclease/phosphatase family protein [Candidatus Magasanikbacteria bacterium]|jgi:endonuclease/exonuclease/phosphatase family metal-dependent hydrolase|nr:endonuclease/exonuclease/phosphatase family protein [Candidatus Magasanikbacteria bacterium]
MRIETLNIWGGQVTEPLLEHFQAQADSVDIFCLQEVFNGNPPIGNTFPNAVIDIYSRIADTLPNHTGYFRRSQNQGLASFVNRDITLQREGDIFVYRWFESMEGEDSKTHGRNMQYMQFMHEGREYTVANLHGLWNGQGKTDTDDRIAQSQKAKAFLDQQTGAKILVGDFNLLPDTRSLAILEEGMVNLVKEYEITSTRSSLYPKPERFADYILVSPDVAVTDFRVLPDEVSDHLVLQVDF